MALSKLSAKCRACPKVDTCDHKEMEAYGFLPYPPQREPTITAQPGSDVTIRSDTSFIIDELVKEAARVFQIPERILRGEK